MSNRSNYFYAGFNAWLSRDLDSTDAEGPYFYRTKTGPSTSKLYAIEGRNTGKVYIEFQYYSETESAPIECSFRVGLVPEGFDLDGDTVGDTADSWCINCATNSWRTNSTDTSIDTAWRTGLFSAIEDLNTALCGAYFDYSSGSQIIAGIQLGLAIDFDAGKVWARFMDGRPDQVENWDGDPTAGTDPTWTFTPNTTLVPAAYVTYNASASLNTGGCVLVCNPGNARRTPPSGFVWWDRWAYLDTILTQSPLAWWFGSHSAFHTQPPGLAADVQDLTNYGRFAVYFSGVMYMNADSTSELTVSDARAWEKYPTFLPAQPRMGFYHNSTTLGTARVPFAKNPYVWGAYVAVSSPYTHSTSFTVAVTVKIIDAGAVRDTNDVWTEGSCLWCHASSTPWVGVSLRGRRLKFHFQTYDIESPSDLDDGVYDLAFVYDAAADTMEMFIDGVSVASLSSVVSTSTGYSSFSSISVGSWRDSYSDGTWPGYWRDMRLWFSALSDTQIAAQYAALSTGEMKAGGLALGFGRAVFEKAITVQEMQAGGLALGLGNADLAATRLAQAYGLGLGLGRAAAGGVQPIQGYGLGLGKGWAVFSGLRIAVRGFRVAITTTTIRRLTLTAPHLQATIRRLTLPAELLDANVTVRRLRLAAPCARVRRLTLTAPHLQATIRRLTLAAPHLQATIRRLTLDAPHLQATVRRLPLSAELFDTNVTVRRLRVVYHLYPDAVTTATIDIYARVGVTTVPVQSARLRAALDSPYWQADIVLWRARDYSLFPLSQPFTLHYCGTDYALIVDQPDLDRGMDGDGNQRNVATIRGLSPAAALDFPRAEAITLTFDQTILASVAAAEILGQSLQWAMVDWPITAYRLALTHASPLAAVQNIVQAAGGVLQSLPDGTLRAQPRFSRTMPSLRDELMPADYALTADDISAVAQKVVAETYFNWLRVMDVEPSFQDKLEFEPDAENGLWGTLYAYPSPWRTVTVRNTRGDVVKLYPQGTQIREVEETIDILAGEGNVKYPVLTVLETVWEADNLGAVAADSDSTVVRSAIDDYSRLYIRYRTRAVQYRAQSELETSALELLEDDDG